MSRSINQTEHRKGRRTRKEPTQPAHGPTIARSDSSSSLSSAASTLTEAVVAPKPGRKRAPPPKKRGGKRAGPSSSTAAASSSASSSSSTAVQESSAGRSPPATQEPQEEEPPQSQTTIATDDTNPEDAAEVEGSNLRGFTCPICFSPPSNACLTTCGHVMCGACLFAAVKATRQRHVRTYGFGPGPDGETSAAKCPVCRALLPGWDGRGGGVIPLRLYGEQAATS